MNVEIKNLPKSQKEIKIEVLWAEMEKYIEIAADKLSKIEKFDGFRKGKTPVSVVKQQLGINRIFEEASNIAIKNFYAETIRKNNLIPIGQPKAEILKMAFGNPLEFRIVISVIPEIPSLNYKNISGKAEIEEVKESDVESEIKILQKKTASYTTKNSSAQKGDRVEIDFESRINGVKIENGESKNHPLIIGEGSFVSGFEDKLVGMSKGEVREFNVVFPNDHKRKELSGRNVTFKVKMNVVQEVKLPEVNDKFAKSLGKFESLNDLKKSIKNGIEIERKNKAVEELRNKWVDEICEKVDIEIPDILVDSKLNSMMKEFEESVTHMGVKFDEYLDNIKTSKEKLRMEWRGIAEKKAKQWLVLTEISKREKINVDDNEVEEKMNQVLKLYPNEEEVKNKINIENFKENTTQVIMIEKVFKVLEKIAESNLYK